MSDARTPLTHDEARALFFLNVARFLSLAVANRHRWLYATDDGDELDAVSLHRLERQAKRFMRRSGVKPIEELSGDIGERVVRFNGIELPPYVAGDAPDEPHASKVPTLPAPPPDDVE